MSKPDWAVLLQVANVMEQRAEIIRRVALGKRCPDTDSGGARCTRDQGHEGGHRVSKEDLP